ncbi:MAG: hypothetical protein ABSD58_11175 [Verrucomicrobiia bacterium]|jgi:hypothetical protein
MKSRARAGLLLAVTLLCGVWFFICGFERARSRRSLEKERAELTDELMRLQANLDEERLQWYYAFREVEEVDDRAWEMAVRKADSEIAAKSNALANVKARLDRLQTFQAQ